jgi:hypothetical protein
MHRKRPYVLILLLLLFLEVSAQRDSVLLQRLLFNGSHSRITLSIAEPDTEKISRSQPFAIRGRLPAGMQVLRQLSDSLFIVNIYNREEQQQIQSTARILGRVTNRWKLSPALLNGDPLPAADERVALLLTVANMDSFHRKYSDNQLLRIDARFPANGSLRIRVPVRWIESDGLPDPNILFIAQAGIPMPERELTGFDLSTNRINLAHRIWPAITGKGLTVSVKENKMDTADMDFRGRYLPSSIASSIVQTHATTMATIAAGAGNSYYTGKGVAWGASISSADFANLLPDDIQELKRLKVAVQNHSYGVGIENYYGADAAAYDAQIYSNPNLLHIFSAGNAGTQSSTAGNYSGINAFANLTGSFKMAKNTLTVGATDSFGTVAAPSSRGPAYDGRVAPSLVALGEDGSSGAAAIVSGIGLLVQDAWQQKNGDAPASALTKAILLNSADDVGPAGIDFQSGYGSANATAALETVQLNRVLQGSVSNGQTITHTLDVPANARNLKLTLCWTDPPAASNRFKALINDLDLTLVHTNTATSWLPWVLNSYPAADSLRQLPVRKRDSLNNTEQISISLPPAGTYQVQVKGYAIPGAAQPYAIAWQYDTLAHFRFSYPVKNDPLFPAQTHTIRWQTTLPGTAELQYRINAGNWKTATANLDLSRTWFQWQAPDTMGAVQFRLLAGAKEWYSDTVGLAPRLLINTGLNCADSFLLYWQKAPVTRYRIYQLGPQYLQALTEVTDTLWQEAKQNINSDFFTMAPVLPFQTEGARAYTFNYTQQQVGCYINGFIADPAGSDQAKLQLQLGTTFRVAKVVFEKLGSTGFAPVTTIAPVTDKQLSITTTAGKGLSTFRARVELQNGQVYYTQPENVIQFADQSWYVFPNPLKQGATLHLLSAETDAVVFQLFDLFGRKVFEYKADAYLNHLTLPPLQKGIYYYILQKNGLRQLSHKLVIL